MANDSREPREAYVPFTPTYQTQSIDPAGTPSVRIFLHGLLCLYFNDKDLCTVAVNLQLPSHTPEFGVVQKVVKPAPEPPECKMIDVPLEADFKEMYINVRKSDDPAGTVSSPSVYVYDGPRTRTSSRYSYVEYGLDLEKLHGFELEKNDGGLWPRFYITNGLFHACRLSKTEFAMYKRGAMTHSPRSVALVVAADIYLQPDECVEFVVDGKPLTPTLTYGNEYEIAITNTCTSATECHFKPDSMHREERNDFYMYYRTVKLLDPADQFELVKDPGSDPDVHGDPINLGPCWQRNPFSDPAPCLPIGFGLTRGL